MIVEKVDIIMALLPDPFHLQSCSEHSRERGNVTDTRLSCHTHNGPMPDPAPMFTQRTNARPYSHAHTTGQCQTLLLCSHNGLTRTLMCLADSGLKRGVRQYWKNRVAILFLSPAMAWALRPLTSRSASLSTRATSSRVRPQSCS